MMPENVARIIDTGDHFVVYENIGWEAYLAFGPRKIVMNRTEGIRFINEVRAWRQIHLEASKRPIWGIDTGEGNSPMRRALDSLKTPSERKLDVIQDLSESSSKSPYFRYGGASDGFHFSEKRWCEFQRRQTEKDIGQEEFRILFSASSKIQNKNIEF